MTNPPVVPSDPSEPRLVVGIGASAGGLSAIRAFFAALPPTTGAAFVITQHLAPDYESKMPELLAGHTSMPVRLAEDGARLTPNTIFLNRPDRDTLFHDGHIELQPISDEVGKRRTIDRFLGSLAADAEDLAVAVILSGTGEDGAEGVREIAAHGGYVMAQSPESAEHGAMPRAVIQTGLAQDVLDPAALAARIAGRAGGERPELSPKLITRVTALLRARHGIDFNLYKQGTVTRRIARRVEQTGAEDLTTYADLLEASPDELDALYHQLLIGVTAFFRDPAPLDALEHHLLPELVEEAAARGGAVRIWVAGCATGEEAYTLAMLADEARQRLAPSVDVKVFATDVHRGALEQASRGVYPAVALEPVSEARRERYFVREGDTYRVSPALRRALVFTPHDLLSDPPFVDMGLIVCRNVLIYLRPATQRRVLARLLYGLRIGGLLLLGPSEHPGAFPAELGSVPHAPNIFRKRASAGVLHTALLGPRRPASPPSRPDLARGTRLMQAYDALLERYVPASLLIGEEGELLHTFGDARLVLHTPEGRSTTDVLQLVAPHLATPLATALLEARQTGRRALYGRVDDPRALQLVVDPLPIPGDGTYFQATLENAEVPPPTPVVPSAAEGVTHFDRILVLEEELRSAREHLRVTFAELDMSNQEVLASNEELSASNEELQSANEELHSLNEELQSLNAEHEAQIALLHELTGDLENLLEAVPVGVVFLDRGLSMRRFNTAAARALSLTRGDLGRGIQHLERALLFDADGPGEIARRALAGAEEQEVRGVDSDGTPYLVRASPYRDRSADDAVTGAVLSIVDLTELERVREEREEHERRFADLAAHVKDVLWIFGPAPEEFYLSPSAEHVFGVPPEALPPDRVPPWLELVHPDDRALAERGMQELAGGADLDAEYRLLLPDGRMRTLRARGTRSDADARGRHRRFGICTDVTERVEREALLRATFVAAPDAILVIDSEGRLLMANAGAEALFGYSSAELATLTVEELLPERARRAHVEQRAGFHRAPSSRRMGRGYFPIVTKDGRALDADVSLGVVGDGSRVVAVVRDVTARVAAERAALAREAETQHKRRLEIVGRLAGGVAHDFNNLLTSIISFTSLVRDELAEDDPHRQDLEEVLTASESAGQLTRQLLSFSQRHTVVANEMDLSEAVARLRRILEHTLPDGIRLVLEQTSEPLLVQVDPAQLDQLVLNLVVNARDAMPDGGAIYVRTYGKELDGAPIAVLQVQDTGQGIEAEVLERIFEPFFTTRGRGTGLGLATCYGIAMHAGGDLTAVSEPGTGATFTVTLPLRRGRRLVEASQAPRETQVGRSQSGSILVVEDEAMIRTAVERSLVAAGYTVRLAESAEDALGQIEAGASFDLLLTDVVLPGLSGVELVERLRRGRPDVPVVICSGYLDDEALGPALAQPRTSFVAKPFTPASIVDAVRTALATRPTDPS